MALLLDPSLSQLKKIVSGQGMSLIYTYPGTSVFGMCFFFFLFLLCNFYFSEQLKVHEDELEFSLIYVSVHLI